MRWCGLRRVGRGWAGGVTSGTVACAGASSSWGTDTVSCWPSARTTTLVSQDFRPGALALTVCSPGSTGTAVPTSEAATGAPSRRISTLAPVPTARMVSLESRGSSAAARVRAVFSRLAWPAALAW